MYSVNTHLTETMVNADRLQAGLVVGRLVRVASVTGANIGLAIVVAAIVLLLLLALFLSARRQAQPSGLRSRASGDRPRRAESQPVTQAAPAAADTNSAASRVPNETTSVVEGAPAISNAGTHSGNGRDPLVAVDSPILTDIPQADEREPLPVGSTAPQETFSWSMPEEWSAGTPSTQGLTEPPTGVGQQAAGKQPDLSPQHATDSSQADRTPANVLVLEGNEHAGGGGDDTMSKSVTAKRGSRGRSASRAAKSPGPEITVSAVPEGPSRVNADNDERNDESHRIPDDQSEGAAPQPADQQPVEEPPAPINKTHARVDDAIHMARLLDETLRGLAQEMEAAESQNREMRNQVQSMEESSQVQVAFRDSLVGQVSAATAADDLAAVQELVRAVVENPNNLMVLLRLYEQSQRLSTVVQEYADLRRLIQSDGFPAA